MSKNITVSFYACCLPDYFGGYHLPVLQYPVDRVTTRKELYNGLLSELNMCVIDYEIEENNLDYDDIRKAIFNCLFFKPECKDEDILFPSLEVWSEDDNAESCYAFFVVRWEEEEESE